MTDTPASRAGMDRRAFLVGGAMLAAAGTAAARIPKPNKPPIDPTAFKAMMPELVGDWRFVQTSGLVLPPDDALSARLYDNLVTRAYTNATGQTVMVLVAYKNYQNGVLQIHRPEICYPAGGYQLSPTAPTQVEVGPDRLMAANSFSATGGERDEQVLYWTRIGDEFPTHWSEQRMAVLRANLAGINPDGMLARVSMVNNNMALSEPLMTDFIRHLRLAAPPAFRRILFGPLA